MNKLRILIVDNNSEYRKSLRTFLELEDFSVIEASSIDEASGILNTTYLDVALVDLRLKDDYDDMDFSGLDVAREIRKKEVPCIIITAFESVESARLALKHLGAKSLALDYVLKKAGPQAVLIAIRKLCGITLLHISDLHPKTLEVGEEPSDQDQAYSGFLENIQGQPGLALNPIRTILVSGDISFQFQAESFDRARSYLERLSKQLRIPLEKIVLTPGNHDINRNKASLTQDSLLAIRYGDSTWFNKFDEYLNFTRHFYGEPAFTIDKHYRIFTFDNRVAVVAFNSCLVEGNPKYKCKSCETNNKIHYHGWIDRHQVKQAGEELDHINWPGLRIGMFHHHVIPDNTIQLSDPCQGDHLWPYDHPDYRLKFTFDEHGFRILLHGHRHKVKMGRSPIVGSNVPYHFGSGAFWTSNSDEQETANYLLLQLSPIEGGSRVLMGKYHHQTEGRKGYWGPDDSIQSNGIIPLPDIIIPPFESNV
jgi:CheY-like chemotaxis protein